MDRGVRWVALDVNLSEALPKDRPYSRVEAMFSLTRDIYFGRKFPIRYYSKQWKWSKSKVQRFFSEIFEGEKEPNEKVGQKWDKSGTTFVPFYKHLDGSGGTKVGQKWDSTNNNNNNRKEKDVVVNILLKDDSYYAITEAQAERWQEIFPRINVRERLLYIAEWNRINPEKRKTSPKQVMAHVSSWLNRDNEKAPQPQEWI